VGVPSVYALFMQPVSRPVSLPVSQRLSQPVLPSATQSQSSTGLWLTVAVVLLLVLVAGLAAAFGWAAHTTRRLRATDRVAREALRQIGEVAGELARITADVTRLGGDTERVKAQLVTAGAQIASERVRSDRILDLLADLPPVDVVTSREYRLPDDDS